MKPISILILVMITATAFIGCRKQPQTLSRVEVRKMNGLTTWEYKLLNKKTKGIPVNGLQVASRDLSMIIEKYDMPYGIAVDGCKPILSTQDDLYQHAQLYVFSFVVKSAKSCNLAEKELSLASAVKLSTASAAEEPVTMMCIFPVASSKDGHTHIFRSNYFLPVSTSCDYVNDGKVLVKDRWNLIENAELTGSSEAFEVQIVPMKNDEDHVCIVESDKELESSLNRVVSMRF